ncbi:uncharacterized protein K02A2.6-like [Ornithodoros turicata]|uniref:uncharacterized protein K02A2.6-like n=1 Tax=Ornithodoros turicata TaxID=34597 RepID=UPI0031388755
MAIFGTAPPFDADVELWSHYAERLERYFVGNKITDGNQRTGIFLSVVGPKTYGLLRSLLAPAKPSTKTFVELVATLSSHFAPKPSEIVERFRFNSRVQQEKETVSTFIAELRKLSEFCEFGTTLDTMIRDRLVCGVRDIGIQKRLLAERELTLEKATTFVCAVGMATKNAMELSHPPDNSVNRIINRKGRQRPATPIVPVKKDGTVRICGDFKVTLNRVCDVEQYPLPKIEDMFASLSGAECFSKVDLRDAYQQIPLDEDSQKVAVINTHRDLYSYKIPMASLLHAIFQRRMESLLREIPGTQVFLDDILIGEREANFGETLRKVLQRLQDNGVRMREDKCEFQKSEVSYFRHRIDKRGLHLVEKKLRAIIEAPAPKDVHEFRSFLGLLTCYRSFIRNMSSLLRPLYDLLKNDSVWKWDTAQEEALKKAKDVLVNSGCLTHFDPSRELQLECDASPYGVAAVLSHRKIDQLRSGRELSRRQNRTTPTWRRKHWHLFSESRNSETTCGDDSSFSGRTTNRCGNADALSRIPKQGTATEEELANSEAVCSIQNLVEGPLSAKQLAVLTSQDATLSALRDAIQRGWLHKLQDKALQPYWSRRDELSTDQGLIMWGRRIIIPAKARHVLLLELQSTHSGMATMKAVARSLFWWPGIGGDIESSARHCLECQLAQPMLPAKEPLFWPSTTIRWSRVHIDYAGPVEGMMLLIVEDSFSRWIEAIPVKNASSEQTVKELRGVFARFGIPHCAVSDNGTPFNGKPFQDFVKANGIRHIRTALYHPQPNGLAESAVRTVNDALKKMKTGDLRTNVDRWLHSYRRSPNTVSGKSPSEMLLGYNIRSRLDLISVRELHNEAISKPDQARPSREKGSSSETGVLQPGAHVFARNYGRGQKWIPGVVQNQKGVWMAVVKTAVGDMTRHADQLR